MKSALRSIVASILAMLSRAIVHRYRPTVVMVTGSVGKTSTKDAIAAALSAKFYLRKSEKSYNSEFGLPLTVIGAKNPWNDPFAWFRVIGEGFALLLLPNHYPKLLVLEVGADSPGDLARILRIASPDVVVVTRLPEIPVHVEAYAGPDAVREEEFAPAYALKPGAPLIISADDSYARTMAARLSARCISYGFEEISEVHISDAHFEPDHGEAGMLATVEVGGKEYPLAAHGVIGRQQLYAPAAALATALALNMTVAEALEGLASYAPPPGRGRVLSGLNDSLLVDDSYNASPAAVEEALASLALATEGHAKSRKRAPVPEKRRRIAVLGDMLELGRYSLSEHERIGVLAAETVDVVISVGERARAIVNAARSCGIPQERAFSFGTSAEAAEALPSFIEERDIVLVKGSQSIRTERIVEALLADPSDVFALARQDKEWRKKR